MPTTEELILAMGKAAKSASYKLAIMSTDEKNHALQAIAKGLNEHRSFIKAENQLDINASKSASLSSALLDRLLLTDQRIDQMIQGVLDIEKLSDPIGKLITSKVLANGIDLKKVRVPLGVMSIIFESRPNVIADVTALCLKTGNALILRGGKEAQHSNRAIMHAIDLSLRAINFLPNAVQMVPIADREAVKILARMNDYIDVIIPRGGEGLIKVVSEAATVPVIKHYKGVCHIYVDNSADQDMALKICLNAKLRRPGVCNAVETIVVHQEIASSFIPKLYAVLDDAHVEMRGDDNARRYASHMRVADESDWSAEYLDLIVAVKVVNNLSDAITHINTYGSHHSDAIIAHDKQAEMRFTKEVDSAVVYVNASTSFTDGFEFGFGAEMGISTDKLHARGPMGLEELTTYKWVALGQGQIRA